ncbi:MAG: FtsW/RodA/SpoVE family cell cycle protein, partial [Paramuribaculum sp.]|nr:FtsW/RodA/SpoVE family cell cycle protein [Paramuribaculum sp.]
MHGYMAQANGGFWGVLPGNSRETQRLPLAVSDYIYAVIVEEWGLIGGIGVLILYLWLLGRASSIASRCNQRFAALLVIGMAVMIVLQALFHMAIVTGVFPVSGQPLPLISKGGTSILVNSMAFGVMLSVSRYGIHTGRKQDERDERESLPESLRSANENILV